MRTKATAAATRRTHPRLLANRSASSTLVGILEFEKNFTREKVKRDSFLRHEGEVIGKKSNRHYASESGVFRAFSVCVFTVFALLMPNVCYGREGEYLLFV